MTLSSASTAAAFSGLDSAQVYAQGIASGDPYQDSVILWTRINPPVGLQDQLTVGWEIATTAEFQAGSQVASGNFQTDASRDWTVKVEATGLESGHDYYYRFLVGDVVSQIGQTRTLPSVADTVHLAVFSCANYTAVTEFLAYGRAASIESSRPYDAALFLGDYLYEYGPGGYAAAEDASQVRGFTPVHELISLDDYRQRYAQVNTDPGLLALRASVPMIAIWDDHETANDSWVGGAENQQSATEGSWSDRVAAALQAFYEWIPIREPSQRRGLDAGTDTTPLAQGYRSFSFGDVLSLHMLETRLFARDQQLSYPDAAAVRARIGAILADPALIGSYSQKYSLTPPSSPTDIAAIQAFAQGLASPVTSELVKATTLAAYADPTRDMVGPTEFAWLQQQMAASQATWQVLGQQVLMMNVAVPAELLLNPGDPTLLAKYAAPLQKLASGTAFSDLSLAEQALFSEAAKIPYNLDAWDGYGADRERILQSALALGKKLVSLSGDTHNAWAGSLTTMAPANAGTLAGLEFATPGVSSPGFEKYLTGADAFLRTAFAPLDGLDGLFEAYVKDLSYADLNHRGFLDITFSQSQILADFQLIDSYDPITGVPIWRSELLTADTTLQLSPLSSRLAAALPIVWQSGWQELDLQAGVVIFSDGSITSLDPADYGVTPTSSVLLPGIPVQGSDTNDRIDAASGARIDAGAGNDFIRSAITGSRGDNTIFGGAGADSFVLGAAGDRVYGGLSSDDPSLYTLDGEANSFLVDLDTLNYDDTPEGVISLLDFQIGLDRLQLILPGGAITDVALDSSTYATRKAELRSLGVVLNAAPILSNEIIKLSASSFNENIAAGSAVATLSSLDPNASHTYIYSLISGNGSTDNAAFTIAGDQLKIMASPDFETKSSYAIRVRTTDQDGLRFEREVTLTVANVNEKPTGLNLSTSSFKEKIAPGSTVATLSCLDPDAANTFTYSLASGVGSTDNEAFSITGNQLKITASPNFETKSYYDIRLRTTDQGGLSLDRQVALIVANRNEAREARDLSYTTSTGDSITVRLLTTAGNFEGDVSFNRLAAAPTFTNQKAGLVIGQTGINFSLKLDQSSNSNTAKTFVDLAPLLDGLSSTNKRLAYFVYDTPVNGEAPVATPFTYDPTKKAGARFYDLDGNGSADTADLQFIDGGYGDKDGIKVANGVVVDPSTPGVVSITPKFTATASALTVADPNDSTSPAAVLVRASLSAKAASVNQIGYVALNATEADTLTYELVRDRGTILLANLENSGAPNVAAMNFQRDISLINGQKLVLFEVVDTTLESLLANNSTLAGFGASFRTLDLSKTSDIAASASKGGNTVALSLLNESAIAGLGDLISSQMADTPILDFTGLAGRTLEGSTVSLAREANYDTTIGFYRIQRADGAVLDPITNALITPGSAGYRAAALSSTNLFSGFGTLAVANGATRTDTIAAFNESGLLAPYATVAQTGDTFFSFRSANSDNLNHFRVLGSGVIGLEDLNGGGDLDFDDNIVSFNFKLKQGTLA